MTRPPPPAAATCNLFCLRARVAGEGAAGSGRGVAPQLRRWCWRSAGRSGAPSPEHPVPATSHRPAPSPPLPPALPLLGRRRCRRPRSTPGLRGGAGGEPGPRPPSPPSPPCRDRRGGGRGPRGWSRLRPVARAGLKEARCCRCHHRRSGPGPSVQPSLPPPPVRGCSQPPAPPARLPAGSGREMAPRLRLVRRAPPPCPLHPPPTPALGAGRPGAMCGRGLALDRPFLPSRVRGGAVDPRWRRGVPARLASPSAAVRTARGKSFFLQPRRSLVRPPAPGGSVRGDVGPVPLTRLWQGCSGRKTNLYRRPAAWFWPPTRPARRRGAPRSGAPRASAGTHLSAAQGASVSFDTPLPLRV